MAGQGPAWRAPAVGPSASQALVAVGAVVLGALVGLAGVALCVAVRTRMPEGTAEPNPKALARGFDRMEQRGQGAGEAGQ